MVVGSSWTLCFANELLSAPAPLIALHALLKQMHYTFKKDLVAFQKAYASNVQEAAKYLAQVNFEDYALKHGDAPSVLHFAAGCGCLEICTHLLQYCRRLNFAADDVGQTPIFWSVQSGVRSTVTLLLQYRADATLRDSRCESLLHVVARAGFPLTCNLLLSLPDVRSQIIETRSYRGHTPLHVAATHGHAEVVSRLLEGEADPMATTPQGRSPLHLATLADHAAVVERLLQAGLHDGFDHSDAQGMRALDYAFERGLVDISEALSSENSVREGIRCCWKHQFEPSYRSCLNVPLRETWLEISRPKISSIEHQHLRLHCRVTDALGLLQGYDVEAFTSTSPESLAHSDDVDDTKLASSESSFTVLNFARCRKQKRLDDVEFRIPRLSDDKRVWTFGAFCRFRVIGIVSIVEAEKVGYSCGRVTSEWTNSLRLH
mmetsp:Transcript_115766/g.180912  ORF Transcript_115766/g.180912 Transcript_115766/m.180912 type:complete len:433 (+) Transcript_115766:90-1388(+)